MTPPNTPADMEKNYESLAKKEYPELLPDDFEMISHKILPINDLNAPLRQAFINGLSRCKPLVYQLEVIDGYLNAGGPIHGYSQAHNEIKATLASFPAKVDDDGWIMVESELPPCPNGGEQYPTWDGKFQEFCYFHVDQEDGEKWWENTLGDVVDGITHWMKPITSPPKTLKQ